MYSRRQTESPCSTWPARQVHTGRWRRGTRNPTRVTRQHHHQPRAAAYMLAIAKYQDSSPRTRGMGEHTGKRAASLVEIACIYVRDKPRLWAPSASNAVQLKPTTTRQEPTKIAIQWITLDL